MPLPDIKVESITRLPEKVAKLVDKVLKKGDPWDRQKGESNRAYEAFLMFRDMGVNRERKVVMEIYPNSQNWSGKFDWTRRAESWDDHLRAIAERAMEQEKTQMAIRQARIGVKMQEMAERTLDARTVVPQSVGEVVKLAEVGSKIERLARGASTENSANVHVFKWDGPVPPWAPQEIQKEAERGGIQTQTAAEQPSE